MQCFLFSWFVNIQGKRWEIYSFLAVEKRGKGKAFFADFGFGAGGAVCKCAFTVAVGFIVRFLNKHERM